MKRTAIMLLLCSISFIQYGQIIADHTVVDKYDEIPQYYIDKVKEMWVVVAGESHSQAYRTGLLLLESANPVYQVKVLEYGTPDAYNTTYLRASRATWGDLNNSSGWIYTYGEEDWWTNSTGVSRTKAGLLHCHQIGPKLSAIGFGWCWDPQAGSPSTTADPVYGVRWYGWSDGSPQGSRAWGLDNGDNTITGNSVNMDTYLNATQDYINYCQSNNIDTRVFFTTGPVDRADIGTTDEGMYNAYLKYEHIRNYVKADQSRILFDYADILSYNASGVSSTLTWNGHTFPTLHPDNRGGTATGHIGSVGALRLAKAMWWMLARMAGWDGGLSTPPGTWVGLTTDWNTGSNWYGGTVPAAGTDVTIPPAAKQPVISGTLLAVCNNLTISPGASCTLNAGGALTVNGNLSSSGTLTIFSDATNNSGSMIVKGSRTGLITYNRFLRPENNAGDRHFFSSPVEGQSLSGFIATNIAKINILDTKYQLWEWDEELLSDNWQIVSSGNFMSGEGYNVDQKTGSDGMLAFTGYVVNSASYTATSPYVYGYTARTTPYDYGYENPDPIWSGTRSWTNYGGGGWNLMGNPFTSAMEASAFITANAGKFDPYYQALYVYDGINNVYKYAAASLPGFTASGSYGNYVQAGQGFFVIALYNGIVFNFTPAMQVHNTGVTLLKSSSTEEAWPGLQLKVKYGGKESSTIIVYNENMTTGLDPGYDVGQLSTGPDVEIYTTLVLKDNSVNFARQALPLADCDKIIIPVGVDSENGGTVIFSAFVVPLDNYRFWLEDRTTGIFTDLNFNSSTVSLPAKTYGTGRFFIHASANIPTDIDSPADDHSQDLRIWNADDKVIIKGNVSENAICEVYDLQGQKVLTSRLSDGELNTVDLISIAQGVYLVRVVDGPKVFNRKIALL